MAVLMDDPTTYLARDKNIPCVILAGSLDSAIEQCRHYGVSIQANNGITVVVTDTDATAAIVNLPATTPWAYIVGPGYTQTAFEKLYRYFGPPKTMPQTLNVTNVGKAWRADQFQPG